MLHLWTKEFLRSVFKAFSRVLLAFPCLLGTDTLSGSIATMDMCVRHFRQASGQIVLFFFSVFAFVL